jgi:hypothetical protein
MFTIPNLELKTRTFKQDEEMAVELRLIKNSDTLPAINPSRARAGILPDDHGMTVYA